MNRCACGLFVLVSVVLYCRLAFCASIPLRCAIVGDGEKTSFINMTEISNKVTEVNRIFRQVAMTFEIQSCIQTNDASLATVVLTNTNQRARLYSVLPNGDGLKVIFVNDIEDTAVACWNPYGIIAESSSSAIDIAHELGHACGLEDVYDEVFGSNFVISVSGVVGRNRMPDDWGRYSWRLEQSALVRRLLMYGFANARSGVDIPYGDVDGVWQDADNVQTAATNSNCWHTTLAPVGFHYHGNRHPRSDDWVEN